MNKNHPIARLVDYLNELKKLVNEIDINKQIYKEGTTAGQVAFHAAQTANQWLRVRIMNSTFERDKESEHTKPHALEEISNSLDMALKACEELGLKELDLEEKLKEEITIKESVIDNIATALIFTTAHTAGHVSEITMLRDYVSTLR